jgi:hypothetical protein
VESDNVIFDLVSLTRRNFMAKAHEHPDKPMTHDKKRHIAFEQCI